MQLSDLRRDARGSYLGVFDNNEDPRFTNPLLNQWFNDAHRELAFTAKLYRATKVLDLNVGSDGVSWAGLPTDVIEVVPNSVRWDNGSTWQPLCYREEEDLLDADGPLDSLTNGTPAYYFLRAGAELGRQRMIVVYPGADTARTEGLRVGCWIYPREMTDDEDTPAFQPAEHQWLVRQVVAKMAELDLNLGRADAPVALHAARAADAEAKLRQVNEEARRDGPRRILYEEDYW